MSSVGLSQGWSAPVFGLSTLPLSLLQTATLYPAVVFGICFFLNFFIWGEHSSGAVSP